MSPPIHPLASSQGAVFLVNSCQRYFRCGPSRQKEGGKVLLGRRNLHSRYSRKSGDQEVCRGGCGWCVPLLHHALVGDPRAQPLGLRESWSPHFSRNNKEQFNFSFFLPRWASLIPKLRLLFCRVPWGPLTRSSWSTRPDHLCRFAVRILYL